MKQTIVNIPSEEHYQPRQVVPAQSEKGHPDGLAVCAIFSHY